jgi:hypothetical protein
MMASLAQPCWISTETLPLVRSPSPMDDGRTPPSSPSSGFLLAPLPYRRRPSPPGLSRTVLAAAGRSLPVSLEGVTGAPAGGGGARPTAVRHGGVVPVTWEDLGVTAQTLAAGQRISTGGRRSPLGPDLGPLGPI